MSYLSSRDGTQLHVLGWSPPAEVTRRGRVLLVHGYGEHIRRYDHVATAFAKSGFEVRGGDFRGHGQSAGIRGFARRFGEYYDDLETVLGDMDAEGPLFIVAHSFGALVTLRYCLDHRRELRGLVLSSPYFKLKLDVPAPKKWAANVLSAVWPTLAMSSGLRGADVTHDVELQRIYDADPLNNKKATARWFTEATAAQAEVLARAAEIKLPCLVLHGAADPIADPRRTEEVFRRLSASDKTFELLPGQLHEIFNEVKSDREKTIARVITWLADRCALTKKPGQPGQPEETGEPGEAPRVA